MSGILDNKSRIVDTVLTLEGRRQMAEGDLQIKYVSFTDNGAFYKADANSGSADATSRIYFEQSHLPQDSITFEADDSGRLQPFGNDLGVQVKDGRILSYSFNALTSSVFTGSRDETTFLTSTVFASSASNLLQQSPANFRKLRVISTKDTLFDDSGFGIGPSEVEFVITQKGPIKDPGQYVANVNQLESLFNDPRLSRVPNFKYLPPVNKITDDSIDKTQHADTSRYQLGTYPPWGRTDEVSYAQLKHELDYFEDLGFCKTISIDPTSKNNNLSCQFFEQGHSVLHKLDVIDFGQHRTGDADLPLAHVFFAGKVVVDENDTHTFLHLFTMMFQ